MRLQRCGTHFPGPAGACVHSYPQLLEMACGFARSLGSAAVVVSVVMHAWRGKHQQSMSHSVHRRADASLCSARKLFPAQRRQSLALRNCIFVMFAVDQQHVLCTRLPTDARAGWAHVGRSRRAQTRVSPMCKRRVRASQSRSKSARVSTRATCSDTTRARGSRGCQVEPRIHFAFPRDRSAYSASTAPSVAMDMLR